MPKLIDITGQKLGRWTVLRREGEKVYPSGARQPKYLCRCECGNEKVVVASILRDGSSKSCGCLNSEVRSSLCKQRNTTHGQAGSITYTTWANMVSRCTRPGASGYKKYGARGIAVCERWLHSFENFLADMGERSSALYSIERNNPFKGYEPGNCEWLLLSEQQKNKRNSAIKTLGDLKNLFSNYAEAKNLTPKQLFEQLYPKIQ
jgi:hypothetical protein